MIGIVYSSKTGNTQSLANSLNFMESKYCVPVENTKNLEPVDLLCIGFWCDKGDCDDQMKQYLSTLRNQNVFLFGTAAPEARKNPRCFAFVPNTSAISSVVRRHSLSSIFR